MAGQPGDFVPPASIVSARWAFGISTLGFGTSPLGIWDEPVGPLGRARWAMAVRPEGSTQ